MSDVICLIPDVWCHIRCLISDIRCLITVIWCRMSKVRCNMRTYNIGRLLSYNCYQTSDVISDVWYQTSDIRCLTSDNKHHWHQTSDIRYRTWDMRRLITVLWQQTSADLKISCCKTPGCQNPWMYELLVVRPLVVRTPGCKNSWL